MIIAVFLCLPAGLRLGECGAGLPAFPFIFVGVCKPRMIFSCRITVTTTHAMRWHRKFSLEFIPLIHRLRLLGLNGVMRIYRDGGSVWTLTFLAVDFFHRFGLTRRPRFANKHGASGFHCG